MEFEQRTICFEILVKKFTWNHVKVPLKISIFRHANKYPPKKNKEEEEGVNKFKLNK